MSTIYSLDIKFRICLIQKYGSKLLFIYRNMNFYECKFMKPTKTHPNRSLVIECKIVFLCGSHVMAMTRSLRTT